MKGLPYYWYARSPWLVLLIPFAFVYRIIIALRRMAYRAGLLRSHRLAVPVIVVGNITVGGTGKTPLVAWLANYLRTEGLRPGIVSRGYRGRASSWPQQVRPDSDPAMVGDEAVMLAGQCRCPMAVAPDRVAAAEALLEHSDCNIILSDDGLQHYALRRDLEIAVIDGVRRLGSGFLLPAGPLREPARRLREVDMVVVNGLGGTGEHPMRMQAGAAVSLQNPEQRRDLDTFRGQSVHAVAAIGNPERFFQILRQVGMRVEGHAFPDHYPFKPEDLEFGDDRPVLMTEKDAVKCRVFARGNDWYVPVRVEMSREFTDRLGELLDAITINHRIRG
jgi:tetraacyldisaccharide 4'-kinase